MIAFLKFEGTNSLNSYNGYGISQENILDWNDLKRMAEANQP